MDLSSLEAIGLSKNEAEIYIALLRHGESPASKMAEKTGIYRPYVYDTLEKLVEKGLVGHVKKEGKKIFTAAKPGKLRGIIEEKQKALEEILPQLEKMSKAKEEETEVQVFKGKDALTNVLKIILEKLKKEGGENLVMGSDDKKYTEFSPVYFPKFIKELERHKIKERIISRMGDTFFAGGTVTEVKFIPDEFFNPSSTHIINDMIFINIWTRPMYSIAIKSMDVADAYEKYFELLWKLAKTRKWRQYLKK